MKDQRMQLITTLKKLEAVSNSYSSSIKIDETLIYGVSKQLARSEYDAHKHLLIGHAVSIEEKDTVTASCIYSVLELNNDLISLLRRFLVDKEVVIKEARELVHGKARG